MSRVRTVAAVFLLIIGACANVAHAQQEQQPQSPPEQPPQEAKPDQPADQKDDSDPHGKSSGRLFGIFPNHTAVEGATEIEPVTASQKFKMAGLNTFDPVIYAFVGVMATVNRSYGPGASGYFKQYAA